MLGLPASAGAPALAATGGRAVAQLLPPCLPHYHTSTSNHTTLHPPDIKLHLHHILRNPHIYHTATLHPPDTKLNLHVYTPHRTSYLTIFSSLAQPAQPSTYGTHYIRLTRHHLYPFNFPYHTIYVLHTLFCRTTVYLNHEMEPRGSQAVKLHKSEFHQNFGTSGSTKVSGGSTKVSRN